MSSYSLRGYTAVSVASFTVYFVLFNAVESERDSPSFGHSHGTRKPLRKMIKGCVLLTWTAESVYWLM